MGKTELTGAYMAQMADEWRKANPEAWERITKLARLYASQGRRFSMEKLIQAARYDMTTNGIFAGFKVNNNSRAALARTLLEENPQLKDYMSIRKSKVDERSAA